MGEPLTTHTHQKLGVRLKAGREALHLSEKEAAARLNLSTRFILMMESETFESGLPETFIRGYIRSYARLLNLNENEINVAITQLDLTVPMGKPLTSSTVQHDGNQLDRYLRWMSYFIIFLLFVLVIVWWASHPRYNETETMTKNEAPAIPPLPTTSVNPTMITPSPTPIQSSTTNTPNSATKQKASSTINTPNTEPNDATPTKKNAPVDDQDQDNEKDIY